MINGEFVVFPTTDQLEESELDLVIRLERCVLMIEVSPVSCPKTACTRQSSKLTSTSRCCASCKKTRPKVRVQKVPFEAPPSDGVYEKLKEKYGFGVQDPRVKPAASTPGPMHQNALKEQAVADLIPDPKPKGPSRRSRSTPLGPSSRNA